MRQEASVHYNFFLGSILPAGVGIRMCGLSHEQVLHHTPIPEGRPPTEAPTPPHRETLGLQGIVGDAGIEVGVLDFSDLLFERWVGGRLLTATAESRFFR